MHGLLPLQEGMGARVLVALDKRRGLVREAEGTVVQVAGLKSQKAVGMNGQLAVIEGFSTATGRYIVRLNGWSKTVALKPENCIAESG